jgi:L-alanine-DL-glutamate epimerase-like enolase superfamily enzyme
MDWGVETLLGMGETGTLSAPLGYLEDLKEARNYREYFYTEREKFNRGYDVINIPHAFTGLQITEKGYDVLEQYLSDVRSVIGCEIPLAVDHCGHIGVTECVKLAKRAEKYNIAWLEDLLPWQLTDMYKRLAASVAVPLATGEDIYLKEGFKPLLESGALGIVHPDLLTSGGILETKKIGDMAQDYGAAMAIHMAETPVAALAAAHAAAATENFLALEFHSVDVPWWEDLVKTKTKPIINRGFIELSDEPGLGIEALDDDVISAHLDPHQKDIWLSTDEWNDEYSHDRLWS